MYPIKANLFLTINSLDAEVQYLGDLSGGHRFPNSRHNLISDPSVADSKPSSPT